MSNFNINFGHSIWNWRAIGRGLCFALMLVMVIPTWANVKVVPSPGVFGNAVDIVKDIWNSLWNSSHARSSALGRSIAKRIKKGEVVIQFLEGIEGKVHLIAGKKVLHFRLIGGKPPYTILVEKRGRMIGFSHVNSSKKETEVSLKLSKTLKKGAYWVTVSDNSKPKTVVVMQFEVVKNLPLSKKRQPTVGSCAKWLAEQGSKKWAFEAYQFGKNGETDKNILSACGMSQ